MEFKNYLLSEQKEYFADKVNTVLTGVHEFLQAKNQMPAKHMLRNGEDIANQIRKILHTSWPRSEHKYLKVLQKCGVALMKSIEDKGDMLDVINSVRSELEKLTQKLKIPANKLGTGEEETPKRPEPPPPGTKEETPQPIPAPPAMPHQ
jgi:hypothetical protein